jgi:P27 family predicted phage terminase small subunit
VVNKNFKLMPGRIPSIHSLESNDKRPKPVSDGIIPKAPSWLNANAKKIYKKTSIEIVKLGIAGKCDENILAIFSMQLDRLQVLSAKDDKELTEQRMLNDLTTSVLNLSKELGITPSARAKLRIAKVEEEDPLDKFLEND